jgi:hypothetical protein
VVNVPIVVLVLPMEFSIVDRITKILDPPVPSKSLAGSWIVVFRFD